MLARFRQVLCQVAHAQHGCCQGSASPVQSRERWRAVVNQERKGQHVIRFACQKGLAVAPSDVHALAGLAGVLHDLGDTVEAEQRFKQSGRPYPVQRPTRSTH